MPQPPHTAVNDAWAERAAAIRRVFVIPFDGDEAGLDDPKEIEARQLDRGAA